MKRIILSLVTLGIVGAIVTGATTAIFSDTEVSTGNTFTAGAIDLQIDNESYYNGVASPETSWIQADLDDSKFFFNFDDLKPGDWGEDTISIHVNNNESWVCADVTLTSNEDNGSTEPELNDEDPYTADVGELADQVLFIWWADDGDNVLEDDEQTLPGGPLGALAVGETATVPLADSQNNIWGEVGGLPGDSTRYVGKGWCFGELTLEPVAQDDLGAEGPDVNGPLVRGEGFSCNGAPVDNETQTDSLTADISFRAVQSRNNGEFLCLPPVDETTLTVVKVVDNTNGGDAVVGDFNLYIDGSPVTSGAANVVTADTLLVVSEDPLLGYTGVFSGDCDPNGEVTVPEFGSATCTITNTFEPTTSTITVDKIVSFTSGIITGVEVTDFTLTIDDGVNGPIVVPDEIPEGGLPPGTYTITEVYSNVPSGVTYDAVFSGSCSEIGTTNEGTMTILAGESLTCTITNFVSPAT